jgi:pimeloyl-ACP methyl ester carboxylesterase
MFQVFQRTAAKSMRMDFARGVTAYGDPRNPPILFLHGIRLAGKIWEEHALALSDEFYVLTPDLPGHGALADLPFEIPIIDTYLAHIADTLPWGPPLVVGYSLGGYIAMRYATDLPEHTAGLLLTGCSTDVVGLRQSLYEMSVALSGRFPPNVLQNVLAVFFRLTLPRRVAETIIPFRFNQQVFEASRKIVCGVHYSARLAAYRKPVFIVNGQWDVLFRPDESKFAQQARAETVVMPWTTHIAPLSRPAEFTALVRGFARRVLVDRAPVCRDR